MKTSYILSKKNIKKNHDINKLCTNINKVENDDIYFDYNKNEIDIDKAILKGAKTIVTELNYYSSIVNIVTVKSVKNTFKECFKKIYNKLYKNIIVIGVTGTNGKTTVTTLLYKYFRKNNLKATLIGTNGAYINDEYYEIINTTPGIEVLYDIFRISFENKINIIIMEVSSHAIVQDRIHGIKFKIKAITNITQDHLDYHGTFDDYKKVKLSFLRKATIIKNENINLKKKFNINKVYSYGYKNCFFKMNDIKVLKNGVTFNLNIKNNNYLITSNLLGEFNCYNILLFISILYSLRKFNYEKIDNFLNSNIKIPGRMELFYYKNKTIIIDYAHTPDGLEKVLEFAKKIYQDQLITLFGCGGNRDASKRKIMGEIASKYSDYLIITSDNPRNENPNKIIDDIVVGVNCRYTRIVNRKKAIKYAIDLLNNYQCLLILGRGNESKNIINNRIINFSDIEFVQELIRNE